MAQLDETFATAKQGESEKMTLDYGELQAQIADLRREFGKLASQARSAAESRIDTAQQKLQERFSDAEAQIRSNPILVATIAAGLGFLIGSLLSRK